MVEKPPPLALSPAPSPLEGLGSKFKKQFREKRRVCGKSRIRRNKKHYPIGRSLLDRVGADTGVAAGPILRCLRDLLIDPPPMIATAGSEVPHPHH